MESNRDLILTIRVIRYRQKTANVSGPPHSSKEVETEPDTSAGTDRGTSGGTKHSGARTKKLSQGVRRKYFGFKRITPDR